MLKIINGDINITRGDTGYFTLTVTQPNNSKEEYILQDGDICLFTVRKKSKQLSDYIKDDYILQKTFVDNVIKIEPKDTQDLEYGKYYFDVELTFVNGDINTIIEEHDFNICNEVT